MTTNHTPEPLTTLRDFISSYEAAHEFKMNSRMMDIAASAMARTLAERDRLREINAELLAALRSWQAFWDDMPRGQLGKVCCDIGLLNDAFLKTTAAIKKAESWKP